MRSDAQKAADRRYAQKIAGRWKHVKACLKAEEADAFRLRCKENGTTANAVLLAAIRDYMKKQ